MATYWFTWHNSNCDTNKQICAKSKYSLSYKYTITDYHVDVRDDVDHGDEKCWLRTLRWRHDEHNSVSNHQRLYCWFESISKKTSKHRVTGLCEGASPVSQWFPSQKASNAENISIRWRHHEDFCYTVFFVAISGTFQLIDYVILWSQMGDKSPWKPTITEFTYVHISK